MKASLPFYFKIIFLAGTTLLFVSLFVDWYTFQVFESRILTVSWSYNILFEWSTEFPPGITINENFRPLNLGISPALHFFFIAVLLFTLYSIFFKDLEHTEDLSSLRKFSLGFICLLTLVLFYIVIFPIVYLLPNELYFPSLMDNDMNLALRFYYSISYGYVLQLVGFLLIFPYSLHYYITITQFEKQKNTPERRIATYIEKVQEHIDFKKTLSKK